MMCYVFWAIFIGYFIGLSIYVDAFPEDFKTIIGEMNDEIDVENKKRSKPQIIKNNSSVKLMEAISVHYEMIRYFLFFL